MFKVFLHLLNWFHRRLFGIISILPPINIQLIHQINFIYGKRYRARGIRNTFPGSEIRIINLTLVPRSRHGLVKRRTYIGRVNSGFPLKPVFQAPALFLSFNRLTEWGKNVPVQAGRSCGRNIPWMILESEQLIEKNLLLRPGNRRMNSLGEGIMPANNPST